LLDEPPDADPHVRWCERRRLAAASYSIILDHYGVVVDETPPDPHQLNTRGVLGAPAVSQMG
jgi:hypothetical protein